MRQALQAVILETQTKQAQPTKGLRGPVVVATSLYRGFCPTLVRSVVGNAAAFAGFEAARARDAPTFVAGAVAGSYFWTFEYSADVIKSQMQTSVAKGKERCM